MIATFWHTENSALKTWKHFAGLNDLIQLTLAKRGRTPNRFCLGSPAFSHIIDNRMQDLPLFALMHQAV